jgi:hypothetical protein
VLRFPVPVLPERLVFPVFVPPVFIPRFMLPVFPVPVLPELVPVFMFVFIGVEAGVVYAVFVFVPGKFALRFMFEFALLVAVSPPQPASPRAAAQTAAMIDPFSLLISFSWEYSNPMASRFHSITLRMALKDASAVPPRPLTAAFDIDRLPHTAKPE